MDIKIDPHTLLRAEERGTNEMEIKDVVNTGFSIPAKHGRQGKAKIYDFKRERLGKFYKQKMVRVIYAIEMNTIVTVTVYVFYGTWEKQDADNV